MTMSNQSLNHRHVDTEITDRELDMMLRQAHRRLDPILRRIRRPRVGVGVTTTALGPLFVAQSRRGLMYLRFLKSDDQPGDFLRELGDEFDLVEDQSSADQIRHEVRALLAGDTEAIARRAIDLSLVHSVFQRRVLKRLRRVPAGAAITYQGLAAATGSPAAQRAIGNTVGANPIPIYVPCHRVIKSDGSIGNYGGGVERKLALLRAEGFRPDRARRIPVHAVYGHLGTKIFCRPDCSAARRASRERMLIFAAPDNASRAGLRPCKLCRPST
jgi:O-6-methylguanine DNA methyltransferase